jgi:hypothetical protein
MIALSKFQRSVVCAAAFVSAGALSMGAASAATPASAAPAHASVRPAVASAARPNTTLSIRKTRVLPGTTNKHTVICVLTTASTGAFVNHAVIDLDRNGQPDGTRATSADGSVHFPVTVNRGTSATFQCIFPGNNSFRRSASIVKRVTTP